ncbi:hypothetical protein BKH42_06935 [Helicobacter sp. 13S00482-2]|uniref:phage tail protein n=1 Tax=Helicobacter sp. 13S00482-2 TaxID=1476200 RepID=UPI000BCAB21E|nr:phage tail protein [Helicobacter sp. 13S00482-2]PAF53255.1 hypothetical protein BKH42_06935 [Helicobacter sp. 13S00482-2]
MNYIAKEGERLDSVYFKHYGDFNQNQYDAFLMQNHHLLLKDSLEGGDRVLILQRKQEDESITEGLYGIKL